MTDKIYCTVDGCKANMDHRLGAHSWWCKNNENKSLGGLNEEDHFVCEFTGGHPSYGCGCGQCSAWAATRGEL